MAWRLAVTIAARTTTTQTVVCRATAPLHIRRKLECGHGPLDGERRWIEADQEAIILDRGRYHPVACSDGATVAEFLRWQE